MKRIGILGGTGQVGRVIAQIILARDDVRVVIMGRTESKLTEVAQNLEGEVETRVVDAKDPQNLRTALSDIDLLLVAAPVMDYLADVASAALDTGTDWLDILMGVPKKTETLTTVGSAFEDAGLALISSSGIHPGLPAVMVRAIADKLDTVVGTQVGLLMSVDWRAHDSTEETALEFAVEISDMRLAGWVEGRYRQFSWIDGKGMRSIDFGSPFGSRNCILMELEEIRRLPEFYPGLKEAALAMAGFTPFVDWVIMPLAWAMLKISPRFKKRATTLLWNGLQNFCKPPYGTVLIADAWNDQEDMLRVTVAHADGYWLTGAVAAATTFQYLDSIIGSPGYQVAALAVDPVRLLTDIQEMGARVKNFSGKQDFEAV